MELQLKWIYKPEIDQVARYIVTWLISAFTLSIDLRVSETRDIMISYLLYFFHLRKLRCKNYALPNHCNLAKCVEIFHSLSWCGDVVMWHREFASDLALFDTRRYRLHWRFSIEVLSNIFAKTCMTETLRASTYVERFLPLSIKSSWVAERLLVYLLHSMSFLHFFCAPHPLHAIQPIKWRNLGLLHWISSRVLMP